jgi:hypothetical protein
MRQAGAFGKLVQKRTLPCRKAGREGQLRHMQRKQSIKGSVVVQAVLVTATHAHLAVNLHWLYWWGCCVRGFGLLPPGCRGSFLRSERSGEGRWREALSKGENRGCCVR